MSRWSRYSKLLIFILLIAGSSASAKNASIRGFVKDANTGDPLFGANVILVGTSMGSATGIDGKYLISNAIKGKYSLRVSYIGYKPQTVDITVKDDNNIEKDFSLTPVSLESQTVVVYAQATGQTEAINKALSSDLIENVVSSEKIKELPDANAAESIGRLPGVLVVRSGGEGYQISIRGLQPKYNAVTIDGVKMGSGDPNDRSADLSMISSDMLEGIEVKKTITPDMDADVIGGVVNFDMHEAKTTSPGVPLYYLSMQGGYKSLSDARNKYNNYKYVISAEDRFLDERLGVFAQFEVDRRNLTSNQLSATYGQKNNSTVDYITTGVSLFYLPRDRQRYNGAINIDYRIPDGKIKLVNFVSSSSTRSLQEENNYLITNTAQSYRIGNTSNTVNNLINSLGFEQQYDYFNLEAKVSHTYSEVKTPDNWAVSFTQGSQGLAQFRNQVSVNPLSVSRACNTDFSKSYLSIITENSGFSKQRVLSGSMDINKDVNFSEDLIVKFKMGGKYEHMTRFYAYDQYNSEPLASGTGSLFIDDIINSHFSWPTGSYQIPMTNFIDQNFDYGEFLGGEYKMMAPLREDMMKQISELLHNNIQYLIDHNHGYSYLHNDYASRISNYDGSEDHSAFYGMLNAKIGPQITVIGGVRFQNLHTEYKAVRGLMTTNGFNSYLHYDTTVAKDHGYLLPSLTVRYKPVPWFDVRLAYSNTLAYPDFSSIIPRIDMNGTGITWINYNLNPSRSTNYDAYFSFYSNAIGLFTAGAFLKQIEDLIYPWTFYVSGANVSPYLPTSLITSSIPPTGTYQISTYLNDNKRIDDYGVELDWQTHLWYLPAPFSGIVLGVNFTHIFSKAEYPYTYQVSTGRTVRSVDTTFTDRLIYQPDNIINLSVGFDYSDFSLRVAFLYQSDVFTGPNFWPQLRSHTPVYRRWDVVAKQILPWFGIELFTDLSNVNSANDISIINGGSVPTAQQDYGFVADVGIRLRW